LINRYTILTLKAFSIIDFARRFNGLVFAAMAARLTGRTALGATWNPVDESDHTQYGKGCTERTDVATIAAKDEDAGKGACSRPSDIGPGALEPHID
jgi:hypothetical protein